VSKFGVIASQRVARTRPMTGSAKRSRIYDKGLLRRYRSRNDECEIPGVVALIAAKLAT